jgi:hypothetical protein
MDLVIELDREGHIWVYASDGIASEEAWVLGADDIPPRGGVSDLHFQWTMPC